MRYKRLGLVLRSVVCFAALSAPLSSHAQSTGRAAGLKPAATSSESASPSANSLGGGGGGDGDPTTYINAPAPIRPEKFALSEGGVDMRSGQLRYENTDLSIGGDKGLTLVRTSQGMGGIYPHFDRFGTLSHNWEITVEERRVEVDTAFYPNQFDYVVTVSGSRSATFRSGYSPTANGFKELSNWAYNKLTFDYVTNSAGRIPTRYYMTAEDGTFITFRPQGSFECGGELICAYASSVVESDGSRYDLSYSTVNSQVLLQSVVSNRGYAIVFEYGGYALITKACVVNLTLMTLPSSCPAGVPTMTYAYGTGSFGQKTESMTSFTDALTNTTTLIGPYASQIYDAGAGSPRITSTINNVTLVVSAQSFADGRSFAYTWNTSPEPNPDTPTVTGGSYVDNAGRSVSVSYGFYLRPNTNDFHTYLTTPGPQTITDQLGRSTAANYCVPHPITSGCMVSPMQSSTDPAGIVKAYTYDVWRNITQTVVQAKPGSGLPNITTSATYTCSPSTACNKVATKTDSRSQTTSYTYAPSTGQVLTETLPADANGLQAVKRYGYVSRKAWISNGAGGFVENPNPVSLLEQERTCRTTATTSSSGSSVGCAGGSADEVVTTYDYGPNSGAVGNNLLLRGVAVTADGTTRRTCYGYDAQGNRIWETKPRAGLSACY